MRKLATRMACVALTLTGCVVLAAESQYPENILALKKVLGDQQTKALTEPFVGVRTSRGIRPGLFPIQSTGVSTAPITNAAAAFLRTLAPSQLIRTQYAVDDNEWRRWFNVDNALFVRQGISLKEMNPQQRDAAFALLRASLSARGLAQSEAIMRTDQALREINDDPRTFDEELYFLTIMGTPSPDRPWGWQFEGHHLIINYFVLGDQVVMTPTFWGGEPVGTTSGKYAGNQVLQREQDLGLRLMQSLDPGQRQRATLASRKAGNTMKAGANEDNLVLDYSGLPATAMSPAQRAKLLELTESYVGNIREPHARIKMDEVRAHLDETWFAWVGPSDDSAVFYYRIHSPVILIEFDHQLPVGTTRLNDPSKPTRDHIHTIVRTPNGNDYGKDLLAQHLRQRHGRH